MSFPLFIARKIYRGDGEGEKRKVSRPAIRIATVGVAIGMAVMIISVCVVLGFKHSIRNKVIGFGNHITVANFMTLQSAEQYPIEMGDSMVGLLGHIKGVKHVQRYSMKQGLLKTDTDFLGVTLKGIGADYDTTFIHNSLVEGYMPQFSDKKGSQRIVISRVMADKMRLECGQKVFAYFINEQGVRTRRFTVSGIYETNLKHFDETFCFTDIYSVGKLNAWDAGQCGGAEILVDDFTNVGVTANIIADRINRTVDKYGETYSSKTILEMYPEIFSWLDLMDLNVWIILALMIAVSGVTMISGLLIIILERTQMIGVMKALGSRNRQIRHVFLWLSVFIVGKGLLWGNVLGLGIVALQHFTGVVKLDPQTYYVSTVPVELNVSLVVLLNVATLFICMSVLIAPSLLISHIHPAKSMHYE